MTGREAEKHMNAGEYVQYSPQPRVHRLVEILEVKPHYAVVRNDYMEETRVSLRSLH